jgi:hypothetical protein
MTHGRRLSGGSGRGILHVGPIPTSPGYLGILPWFVRGGGRLWKSSVSASRPSVKTSVTNRGTDGALLRLNGYYERVVAVCAVAFVRFWIRRVQVRNLEGQLSKCMSQRLLHGVRIFVELRRGLFVGLFPSESATFRPLHDLAWFVHHAEHRVVVGLLIATDQRRHV